ncbi:MAG: hypothetical protein IJJ25_00100 [Lachnospiraceae bacterium]|nr:hypothetical protein [Lachnospiraceae bacterium]
MSLEKNHELSTDELELVSGGANCDKAATKFKELEKAWNELGFPKHGYTTQSLLAYADDWAAAGYKPDAKTFLKQFKTW